MASPTTRLPQEAKRLLPPQVKEGGRQVATTTEGSSTTEAEGPEGPFVSNCLAGTKVASVGGHAATSRSDLLSAVATFLSPLAEEGLTSTTVGSVSGLTSRRSEGVGATQEGSPVVASSVGRRRSKETTADSSKGLLGEGTPRLVEGRSLFVTSSAFEGKEVKGRLRTTRRPSTPSSSLTAGRLRPTVSSLALRREAGLAARLGRRNTAVCLGTAGKGVSGSSEVCEAGRRRLRSGSATTSAAKSGTSICQSRSPGLLPRPQALLAAKARKMRIYVDCKN